MVGRRGVRVARVFMAALTALVVSACSPGQIPTLPGMGDQPPAPIPSPQPSASPVVPSPVPSPTVSASPTVTPTPPAGGAVSDCPATGKREEQGLTPAALNVMRCAIHNFGDTDISGRLDRSGSGDHPKGQAVDYMVYTDRALGQQVADWAVANHQALDVKYVIWYQQIWQPSSGRWVDCNGSNCYAGSDDTQAHRDHVHVSVLP